MSDGVKFVRIRGRIVPIKKGWDPKKVSVTPPKVKSVGVVERLGTGIKLGAGVGANIFGVGNAVLNAGLSLNKGPKVAALRGLVGGAVGAVHGAIDGAIIGGFVNSVFGARSKTIPGRVVYGKARKK